MACEAYVSLKVCGIPPMHRYASDWSDTAKYLISETFMSVEGDSDAP